MALIVDRMSHDAWILVVEDEDRLRQELVSLPIETASDLGVVRSASTARQALALFEEQRAPAVAFVDIHLPGRSALELAQALPADTRVVFVTVYDRFSLQGLRPRRRRSPAQARCG